MLIKLTDKKGETILVNTANITIVEQVRSSKADAPKSLIHLVGQASVFVQETQEEIYNLPNI